MMERLNMNLTPAEEKHSENSESKMKDRTLAIYKVIGQEKMI